MRLLATRSSSFPVSALTIDESRRLLLIHNRDDGRWAIPGGCVEPNESPEDAVQREMREETGLDVEPRRLVGVFGGPGFRVRYPMAMRRAM